MANGEYQDSIGEWQMLWLLRGNPCTCAWLSIESLFSVLG